MGSGLGVGVGVEAQVRHQTLTASVTPAEDGAAQQPNRDGEPSRDDGENDHLDGTHLLRVRVRVEVRVRDKVRQVPYVLTCSAIARHTWLGSGSGLGLGLGYRSCI